MKNPFRKSSHLTSPNQLNACDEGQSELFGHDEFLHLIDIERSRAHRANSKFSIILINVAQLRSDNPAIGQIVGKFSQRLRKIDQLGWYDKDRIGILLPNTDHHGVRVIANELYKEVKGLITPDGFVTLSYPTGKRGGG